MIVQARDRACSTPSPIAGRAASARPWAKWGPSLGAAVDLEKAPLKYQGLSYTEIWISEAQERMVLAVPPEKWPALRDLCAGEDVEATELGDSSTRPAHAALPRQRSPTCR